MNRHHEALRRHVDYLLSKPDVYAVGLGEKMSKGKRTGKRAIICSIKAKKPLAQLTQAEMIPSSLDGIPTDIVEIGSRPVAFPAYQDKQRPVVPGCSVGHTSITAGTIGAVVEVAGKVMLLSNNHVLADENAAAIGDVILQPGPYDGGKAADRVGVLYNYIPITYTNQTTPTPPPVIDPDPTPGPDPTPPPPPPPPPPVEEDSDCKIANIFVVVANKIADFWGRSTHIKAVRYVEPKAQTITAQAVIRNKVDAALCLLDDMPYVTNYLTYYSGVKGVNELAGVGTGVHKLGRTTGHTTGTITQTNVVVDVQFGAGIARFENQMSIESGVTDSFSAGGDSGSLIVDTDDNAVGLLFAGNDVTTFANPIDEVLVALSIEKFTGAN